MNESKTPNDICPRCGNPAVNWRDVCLTDKRNPERSVFCYETELRSKPDRLSGLRGPAGIISELELSRNAWRECAQRLAELLNKMPHGHTRACTYDLHGSSPESDFCDCGFQRRQQDVSKAIQKFTELNKSHDA